MKNYKLLKLTFAILLAFLGSTLLFSTEVLAAPQTFTVTNTNDTGAGSLRQAIINANGNGNAADQDVVEFNIPGAGTQIIQPQAGNFILSESVKIDGYTQSDAQANTAAWPNAMNGILRIHIDASQIPAIGAEATFVVDGNNVSIQGLSISYAAEAGIRIRGPATGAILQGNYINTTVDGNTPQVNGFGGGYAIANDSADNTTIGGTNPEDRNVLTAPNIEIYASGSGSVIQGNNFNVGANGTSTLSSGNGNAIYLDQVGSAIVGGAQPDEGNTIRHIGNGSSGIFCGSCDNGAVAIRGNVLSGTGYGMEITNSNQLTIADNTIEGQSFSGIYLETTEATISGNDIIDNHNYGIVLEGTKDDATVSVDGNTIQGSAHDEGIRLLDNAKADITNNVIDSTSGNGIQVQGLLVEVTVTGNDIVNNGGSGINMFGSNSVASDISQNTITNNDGNGITIFGNADVDLITINTISGSGYDGIMMDNSADAEIIDNTIENNSGKGISAQDEVRAGIVDNIIRDNQAEGIVFEESSNGFIESNEIYDNTSAGITIISSDTVSASENNIYSNGGLGIDLGNDGVTANDANDPDPGPNTLLNFPDDLVYKEESGNTELTYTLDVPAGNYRVEFYSNSTPDGSGYGEGEIFLESHSAASNGSGAQNFSYTLSGVGHDNISAIATEEDFADAPRGPTSEFSAIAIEYVPESDLALTKTLNNPQDYQPDGTVEYTATLINNGPDAVDLNQLDGSGVNPFATSLFIDVLPPDQSVAAGAMTPFNPTNTNDVECTWYGPGSVSLAPFFPAYSDHSLLLCHYSGGTEELLSEGESFDMTFETTLSSDSDLNYINYAFTGAESGLDPAFDQVFSDCANLAGNNGYTIEYDLLDCLITSQSNNVGFAGAPTNIELTKTLLNPEDVSPGDMINYEVTFTNNGPGDVNLADYTFANNIVAPFFVDIYPANHLTYAGFSSSSGIQCSDVGEATAGYLGLAASDHLEDGLALCVTPNESEILASGESIAAILSFTVDSTVGQSFTNYAYTARTASDPGSLTLYNAVAGATSDILDSYNASSNFVRAVYTASGATTNQTGTSTSGSLSSTGQKVLLAALAALLLITAGGLGLLYHHKRKT